MGTYRYALRIDKEFTATKEFVEKLGFSGIAVRESKDENEHWHWYLEGPVKPQSFRVRLTKGVPALKGNGSYSVKECGVDPEPYWRYILKGDGEGAGYDVQWRHGLVWTDEKLEELHQAYWTENAKLRRKVEKMTVTDAVLEECKRTAVSWEDRQKIGLLYIKELIRRRKAINKFMVKSQCLLITALLCPNEDAAFNIAAEVWL